MRDRASFYRAVLEQDEKSLNTEYILQSMQVSLSGLERALHSYTLGSCEAPFDMKTVPIDAPSGPADAKKDGDVSLPSSAQVMTTYRCYYLLTISISMACVMGDQRNTIYA